MEGDVDPGRWAVDPGRWAMGQGRWADNRRPEESLRRKIGAWYLS